MERQFRGTPRRKPQSADMIFGTRAVIEAIRAGKEIDRLFIQKGLNNELTKELVDTAIEFRLPISKVPVEKLNRITRKNHQGAIAYLSAVSYQSLDNIISRCYEQGKDPFILILDRVTDVRNFGAICRTAECAGVDAIVIPSKGAAQINPDAVKTSAGALNIIPVCRQDYLKDTITYLQESGVAVVAATEKTDNSYSDIDYNQPIAVLMGSEEDGVSPEYLKRSDLKAKIPILGKIESLNVSVAAGIILYEAVRQKGL
ncbi:23S rRNA (guanosine(2251)-2'-O)-methyltransferase RlmB [Persicobacter psychrovividus]|uniref:23S rRNA (Guanosine(2251)-2'-O)-methyltransferase RlmB n=1 Tax=Persicobacter psychrovividus TaxID=387638 RepID=A0ABM7VBB3_9BACT|nr:23S rRNA (guanosine(2251)-2'-O)-methyltransferase RlmB [Persicobacter psychrovividus]